MELFNEIKNKYYDEIRDLIYVLYENKKVSSQEIRNLLPNNYKLRDSLLNKLGTNSLFILTHNESENEYSLNIHSPIPIVLSKIEKIWLKHILSEGKAELFLDIKTIDKLLVLLEDYPDIFHNNIIVKHRDYRETKELKKLRRNIDLIIRAIRDDKAIQYSYITREGLVLEDRISLPYKIEYSIKKDLFYLISYSKEEHRPIKSIMENLYNINIIPISSPLSKKEIKESIRAKKQDVHVVLQVENINNLIERVFLTFSSYSTETKYIDEQDIHEIRISYYSFEKKEILNRIFSLGKGVIVREPEDIRQEIIHRIESCLKLYEP